jgi:hypothetical protein
MQLYPKRGLNHDNEYDDDDDDDDDDTDEDDDSGPSPLFPFSGGISAFGIL